MKLRVAPPKKTLLKVSATGEDPSPITPKQMQEWNQFLDFVKAKGYEGHTDLDAKNKNLGKTLFDEFKSKMPSISISYDIVPSVQAEMQKLKQSAQAFAERRNDPNSKNIMANVSPVDGWFGSKTSQFRFPEMVEQQKLNNQVVSQRNLGLVRGDLQPTSIKSYKKPLPKGVKLEQLQDGIYYEDPQSGDLVKYE